MVIMQSWANIQSVSLIQFLEYSEKYVKETSFPKMFN